MPGAPAPVLQSIVPLNAVPERLRGAVADAVSKWGYAWDDVTFAGTAAWPAGKRWQLPGTQDIWILAITAGPVVLGDVIESGGGRGLALSLSAYSGGYIPVTPYQAQVYEFLGRRGGGPRPESQPPQSPPTIAPPQPSTPHR